jgi:hypothetical protein
MIEENTDVVSSSVRKYVRKYILMTTRTLPVRFRVLALLGTRSISYHPQSYHAHIIIHLTLKQGAELLGQLAVSLG